MRGNPPSRARRGLWALPLLLLLLLAGGMGAAALFVNLGDDGGGDDDRPRELVANLNPTPTADEEITETPTEQPVSTDTPKPAPTDTPAPSPTRTPEPTSTDTPVPTETPEPVPTDTPEPVPTRTPEPVPTDPPPEVAAAGEAGEAIITRRDQADDPEEAGEEAADQTGIADEERDTTAEEPVESGTMTTSFAASDWQGAYFQETGNMRPWSALYARSTGFGTATLSFMVDGEPASETFILTVDGMTSENWTELPIAILINGQQVYSGNSPFPTWSGVDGEQPWRTVGIELPTSVLQTGENTVTFVNMREEGEFSRPPYILLADGTVTIEIFQPGAVRPRYGDTSPMRMLGRATVDGGREPAIGAWTMRGYGRGLAAMDATLSGVGANH